MTIARGSAINNLIMYPLDKPSLPIIHQQLQTPRYLEENLRSPLTLEEALGLKNKLEDDVINNFINNPTVVSNPTCQMLKVFLDNDEHGYPLEELMEQHIPTTIFHDNISVEIAPRRFLNINDNLNEQQQKKLIHILSIYQQDFSWEYLDMKGIDCQLCTDHIHIEKYT
jgi:hypothetical protein